MSDTSTTKSKEPESGGFEEHKHLDPGTRAAVAALRRYCPEATRLHVYKEIPFLKGRLALIEWWDGQNSKHEYGVYVRGNKFEQASVFSEMEQIADYISEHRYHLERITDASTITAVLAIAILCVLTTLQISQGADINPIFTNALTLVLGFYFGQRK